MEDEIRKRDQMARVRALGGALKTTRGTDSRRRSSATQKERDKLERELRAWKVRGCLWVSSLVCALAGHLCSESSVSHSGGSLIDSWSSRYIIPPVCVTKRFDTHPSRPRDRIHLLDGLGPNLCNVS